MSITPALLRVLTNRESRGIGVRGGSKCHFICGCPVTPQDQCSAYKTILESKSSFTKPALPLVLWYSQPVTWKTGSINARLTEKNKEREKRVKTREGERECEMGGGRYSIQIFLQMHSVKTWGWENKWTLIHNLAFSKSLLLTTYLITSENSILQNNSFVVHSYISIYKIKLRLVSNVY